MDEKELDRLGEFVTATVTMPVAVSVEVCSEALDGSEVTSQQAMDLLAENLRQDLPGLTGDLATIGKIDVLPGACVAIPRERLLEFWCELVELYGVCVRTPRLPAQIESSLAWMSLSYAKLLDIPLSHLQTYLQRGQQEPPTRPLEPTDG